MRRLFFLLTALLLAAFATAQNDFPRLRLQIAGKGTVVIRLYPDKAPKAVAHIAKLAKDGFYDGLRFHRVERTPRPYLVQVGDPNSKDGKLDAAEMGTKGSGARIPYENSGLSNLLGAVGLARMASQDRDSGDSQFYIMLGAQSFLDGNYTVFGKVVDGMEIVQKIEKGDRIEKATVTGV